MLTDQEAYFILNQLPGIGPARVKQLLTYFDSVTDILEAPQEELAKIRGIGPKHAATLTNWRHSHDWENEWRQCLQAGITLVTQADDLYPALLKEIYDPPLCLYVKGNVECLQSDHKLLAIVGSRRTSRYGVRMCERIGRAASLAGWTVVSGLARGIDTVAHKTVLEGKGVTVAVIGSGLGRIYPQDNIQLARTIAEDGAVISEFPLMYPPDRRSFPMRNRIIAGLSEGTVVIEGGLNSGSMITAEQALEQGRQVFAVPGEADNPQARGCHKLIKNGAKLTESFSDIIEEFSAQPQLDLHFVDKTEKPRNARQVTLNTLESRIVEELQENKDSCSAEELADAVGEQIQKILSAMLVLEMKKVVRQLPGMKFCLIEQQHGQ